MKLQRNKKKNGYMSILIHSTLENILVLLLILDKQWRSKNVTSKDLEVLLIVNIFLNQ